MEKRTRPTLLAAAFLAGFLLMAATNAVPPKEFRKTQEPVSAEPRQMGTRVERLAKKSSKPVLTLETVRQAGPSDVPADSPAYDAVSYLMYQGIMQGRGAGVFDPYAMATLGAAVTALYRMSGGAPPTEGKVFSDVDARYAGAVAWAVDAGITQGMDGERFGIREPVSRGQLAVLLYRFAKAQALLPKTGLNMAPLAFYPDGDAVPDYAEEALSWALGNGIFRATVGESILAHMPVSRLQMGQALVALARFQDDALAADIHAAQPVRMLESASRSRHADIQTAIEDAARRHGAVGVQVAVVENGALCDTFSYGWATRNETPMTAEHKMRVASISKLAVGLSAMLLWEEGTVDLDADIGTYWGCTVQNPHYPEIPITLRALLTHTSSLSILKDASQSYGSVKQRIQGSGFDPRKPGDMASWEYNNDGFALLGMTLELAANRELDGILQDRLFRWMAIDGAFASGDIRRRDLLVTLYRDDGSVSWTTDAQKNFHLSGGPGAQGAYFAGGLTISAADVGKLVSLLAADGRYEGVQFLSEESVTQMESRRLVSDGMYQAVPLRYRDHMYGRDGLYYHTGSAYGVFNCISYDPDTGDGVVVLTTGADGVRDENDIYAVCGEIAAYIYNII